MSNTRCLPPVAMIIEDDERLATIFTTSISAAGFTTHVARRGDTALLELGVFLPSLVILDLNLPGFPGETVLRAIREDPRMDNTKVIITTADAERARALEDEGDLVLVKPISFSQLRDLALRLKKSRL